MNDVKSVGNRKVSLRVKGAPTRKILYESRVVRSHMRKVMSKVDRETMELWEKVKEREKVARRFKGTESERRSCFVKIVERYRDGRYRKPNKKIPRIR